MGLEPMAFRCGLAIVAHRNGQEVILNIRVVDSLVRPNEGGTFKLVRRPKASLAKEPLRPNPGLAQKVPIFEQGNRLLRGKLKLELQVILQVLTHTGAIRNHLDAMFRQMFGRADTRQHQQLG